MIPRHTRCVRHVLVTNDFPPKIGGIQSYLWELWRRLPPSSFAVLTTPHVGDAAFDAEQPFRVVRTKQRWLLPTGSLVKQIDALVEEVGADFVVLDPAVPLGLLGPRLSVPYVVIGHGAEYVIPDRLVPTRPFIRRVTRHAAAMIGGGEYVTDAMRAAAGVQDVPAISIPPGVDVQRFVPQSEDARRSVRSRFGIGEDAPFVLGVSRLVPRKGFDRLIRAAALLSASHPDLVVAIAGKGRERDRLERLATGLHAPVRFLGRVEDDDLPALYAAADVFAMGCHDRWFGLEQEGFGIVFAEAAAAGVPSVAGGSGGAGEAVVDGRTGFVVPGPVSPSDIAERLGTLLVDRQACTRFGAEARERAEECFSYDHLAERLAGFLQDVASALDSDGDGATLRS
jgi:phosphatidylinositol alpha-1,6-mannosyltransferase